jgi:xylulokinase
MAENTCILAVDLGTSGCKTAVVDLAGNVIAWAFAPVETHLLPGGGAEQNPEDWWRALVSTTRQLLGDPAVDAARIAGVCCSTMGEGTIPVDAEGKPLTNAILWMDMRGGSHLRRQVRGMVNVAGFGVRNIWRWIRLTGGAPSLTGKDSAGHMCYVREELPEIYAKTYRFLDVLDYLNMRLTGRMCTTHDMAVTSWVTDNRDPDHLHYDEKLLRMLGIERDKMPELIPCTGVVGSLTPEAAGELGLSTSVRVVGGAMDTMAAAVGAGSTAARDPHLYLGTSSWLAAHIPVKKTDITSGMASIPCAVPGQYLLIALQATAGGNLTWLRDKLLYPRDAMNDAPPPEDFFARLNTLAATSPPGSNGLHYTPWIYGERSPIEDHTIRAGLLNLSLEHTRADICRAFLEGIALNTRWLLAPFEKNMGGRAEAIRVIGGGGNSALWCQILADALDRPIRQMADPIQANVRGAAFIGAVGLGLLEFDAVPALTLVEHEFTPNPENRAVYDDAFHDLKGIYKRLRVLHRRWNG